MEQVSITNPQSSIFDEFKMNLFNYGILLWREIKPGKQTIIMNDYDSVTGAFKVFKKILFIFKYFHKGKIFLLCIIPIPNGKYQ